MSVPLQPSKVQYTCNGSTSNFAFTFRIFTPSDLLVILTNTSNVDTTLTLGSNYSVTPSPSGYENGGTVTTSSVYPAGFKITIIRNVPQTQDSSFVEGMPTLFKAFEKGLDKVTILVQQIQDRLKSVITAPQTDPENISKELPLAAVRANKYLFFDADGNPRATATITGVEITNLGQQIVQSVTQEQATNVINAVSKSTYTANSVLATNDSNVLGAVTVPEDRLLGRVTGGDITALTASQVNALLGAAGGFPTASVIMFDGLTAPAGWLICDGSAVSRTTYSALFAQIGTRHGAGDGSTTFNLPNLKGRVVAGYNASDTDFNALGKTGGAKTHTLTTAELPSHNHSISPTDVGTGATSGHYSYNEYGGLCAYPGTFSHNHGGATGNTGSGSAHNNLQPYMAFNYIIKT